MSGTEWAIGAFSDKGQHERRDMLEKVVDAAFGKALAGVLAVTGNPGASSPKASQEAPGATNGPEEA